MINVKVITDIARDADGCVQLRVELRPASTLAAVLQELAPQLYGTCEGILRRSELRQHESPEWQPQLCVEDGTMLLAAWASEAINQDRWMLRLPNLPGGLPSAGMSDFNEMTLHHYVLIVSPYLGLLAMPGCSETGVVIPCGLFLQFGTLSRLYATKLVFLFPESRSPDSWMGAATILLVHETGTLYALQQRFEDEMATIRDKISEEIDQGDAFVTIVDCEAVWRYFKGQFQDYVDHWNEGRRKKLLGDLG